MPATLVATVTAPQVISGGKDHRGSIPVEILAFDERRRRARSWVRIVSQYLVSSLDEAA
jgi:hypothetical protein